MKIIEGLMKRFMKSDVLQKVTSAVKRLWVELSDKNNYLELKKVDIGTYLWESTLESFMTEQKDGAQADSALTLGIWILFHSSFSFYLTWNACRGKAQWVYCLNCNGQGTKPSIDRGHFAQIYFTGLGCGSSVNLFTVGHLGIMVCQLLIPHLLVLSGLPV